jgi:hypothetical protein
MEIVLNLAWATLAIAGFSLWLRFERRRGAERNLPLIAITMLVVILFPVISVSDDLWSIPNPAETDATQRRGPFISSDHAIFPASAALPEPILDWLPFDVAQTDTPKPTFASNLPESMSVAAENRAPPVC